MTPLDLVCFVVLAFVLLAVVEVVAWGAAIALGYMVGWLPERVIWAVPIIVAFCVVWAVVGSFLAAVLSTAIGLGFGWALRSVGEGGEE